MTELEQYRQEIDRIDGELVQLFLERMAVTGKVGSTSSGRVSRCWTPGGRSM